MSQYILQEVIGIVKKERGKKKKDDKGTKRSEKDGTAKTRSDL